MILYSTKIYATVRRISNAKRRRGYQRPNPRTTSTNFKPLPRALNNTVATARTSQAVSSMSSMQPARSSAALGAASTPGTLSTLSLHSLPCLHSCLPSLSITNASNRAGASGVGSWQCGERLEGGFGVEDAEGGEWEFW